MPHATNPYPLGIASAEISVRELPPFSYDSFGRSTNITESNEPFPVHLLFSCEHSSMNSAEALATAKIIVDLREYVSADYGRDLILAPEHLEYSTINKKLQADQKPGSIGLSFTTSLSVKKPGSYQFGFTVSLKDASVVTCYKDLRIW
jgi:hypothetical protein